jgi:hypothetical protein
MITDKGKEVFRINDFAVVEQVLSDGSIAYAVQTDAIDWPYLVIDCESQTSAVNLAKALAIAATSIDTGI